MVLLNPVIGAPINGKQKVALPDKYGMTREVITTPEKVDEFLKQRAEMVNVDKKYIKPTAIGAALGAVVPVLFKTKSAVGYLFAAAMGGIFGFFAKGAQMLQKCSKLEQAFLEENLKANKEEQ
jgi:hypothetical protein